MALTRKRVPRGEYHGHVSLVPVLDEMTSRTEKMRSEDPRSLHDSSLVRLVDYWLLSACGAKYELKVRKHSNITK